VNPQDHTGAISKRGPITQTFNGRGVRPWLPAFVGDPGCVYPVAAAMSLYRPQGPSRRVCWRCVAGVMDHVDGHAATTWEDAPPAAGERCPRCERSFGERPASPG